MMYISWFLSNELLLDPNLLFNPDFWYLDNLCIMNNLRQFNRMKIRYLNRSLMSLRRVVFLPQTRILRNLFIFSLPLKIHIYNITSAS